MSTRWLRLEDARRLTRDPWLRAMLSADRPGIYVDDKVTRFKVYYEALERDARGRLKRRQRTATFASTTNTRSTASRSMPSGPRSISRAAGASKSRSNASSPRT